MSKDQPDAPPAPAQERDAWSYEQELEEWKARYEALLRQTGADTDFSPPPGGGVGRERRQDPRYSFQPDSRINIFAHLGPKAFPIVNVSVGGVAFYSEVFFEPGTNLLLSALGMVALDVDVLSCEMVETVSMFLECRYLVRARFASRVNGYLVYVLSRKAFLEQGGVEATLE